MKRMFETLFSMKGKVCVVTGGSRGLGYHMAQGFLEAGALRVYITARKAEACEAAAKELSQYGDCKALPGDVGTSAGIAQLVKTLGEREGHLDVLVNNAGTAWGAPFGEFPEKGWDKVMDLNAKSPFFLTQALAPMLKKNASAESTACVINIGSIAAMVGRGLDTFSYAASKAAVHQLTRILATELAEHHVRVNAIAPGRFYSKMTEYLSDDKPAFEEEVQTIPLRRWGNAPDIAGVAIMLASQAGGFITGQIIAVDGGTTLIR
jgi:NAD(P)-dependent dehydrogenase (short-subunit alcohol dehydrogenase family)